MFYSICVYALDLTMKKKKMHKIFKAREVFVSIEIEVKPQDCYSVFCFSYLLILELALFLSTCDL